MRFILSILSFLISIAVYAQENNAILCADGIDNDLNGFIDCEDVACQNITTFNVSCPICPDGLSFGDVILGYQPGCPMNIDDKPETALGATDFNGIGQESFLFLGSGGWVQIGFTNNLIVNSGDSADDLWIFEVGTIAQPTGIALRPVDAFTTSALQSLGIPDANLNGFFEIGEAGGAVASLDIDAVMPGYSFATLRFDAMEITDLDGDPIPCSTTGPGADIDAVCALSSLEVDCAGVVNGPSILDNCDECLEPSDPLFNQTCTDCNGDIGGTAVEDICGECLQPNDPNFDKSCLDCAGVPLGLSEIDLCGNCFEPSSPNFNNTCNDCAGVPAGNAVLDICGDCLDPADPLFNQSCNDAAKISIPTAFSPNGDNTNDFFALLSGTGESVDIVSFQIYARWGELIFEDLDFDLLAPNKRWDGTIGSDDAPAGIYLVLVNILTEEGLKQNILGNVTLIR